MTKSKTAVVLFNLGGPDQPASVRPFLVNLFTDPAILRVPFFVRPILARIIAYARTKPATANYAMMGGKSPLLELTEAQARALEAALPEQDVRCFVAMRYWHPFSDSTTTTGSSLTAWRDAAARVGLVKPVVSLCCYHSDVGFVSSTAAIVRRAYQQARAELDPAIGLRVLFSAHGLPEIIIKNGDPYQNQVERTVAAVSKLLAIPDLDAVTCYQSRATPQKWISPSTEDEIARAAQDKVALLVTPIAFVSEHSETLVELDVEYRELAHELGVPAYFRVPAQNSDDGFIAALAELVRNAQARGPGLCSFAGGRTCPREHGDCPHALAELGKAA
jgi:ferrochelatase